MSDRAAHVTSVMPQLHAKLLTDNSILKPIPESDMRTTVGDVETRRGGRRRSDTPPTDREQDVFRGLPCAYLSLPESTTEQYSTQSWSRAIRSATYSNFLLKLRHGGKQVFQRDSSNSNLHREDRTKSPRRGQEVVWKLGVLVPSWHSWQVSGSEVGTEG